MNTLEAERGCEKSINRCQLIYIRCKLELCPKKVRYMVTLCLSHCQTAVEYYIFLDANQIDDIHYMKCMQ